MRRVGLGEGEGFVGLAFAVVVRNVDTAVVAIVAARGHEDPAAVARPGGIAVGEGTVERLEGVDASRRQVEQADVGIGMPDVEAAISARGIEQLAAVGTDTWQGGTLSHGVEIEHQTAVAESELVGIEISHVEVVAHGLVMTRLVTVTADGGVLLLVVGGTVVELAAIGRPGGEGLLLVGRGGEACHAVGLDVIQDEFAFRVDDFDLGGVVGVEELSGVVGREGDERQRGVPGWIDGIADHPFLPEVGEKLRLAIVDQ